MEYQWTLFVKEMKKVLSPQAAMIDMQHYGPLAITSRKHVTNHFHMAKSIVLNGS